MRVEVISVDFEEVGAGACFVFLVRQKKNTSKKRIERLESGLYGASDRGSRVWCASDIELSDF